jgi:predicted amidohydrolase
MADDPDLPVIEREYSGDADGLSVGIANISATVPGIEANRDKVLRAATAFRDRGVNLAVFPELCLSGYFWEDEEECWRYMREAALERQADWIEGELQPLLDGDFTHIVLNGVSEGPGDRLVNRTFVLGRDAEYLSDEETYDKVFLPGIEKTYTESGRDDRLVFEHSGCRLGFTTCYDVLFGELLREYRIRDEVDAIVEVASWRAGAVRDYPGLNVRTDHYYGELWESVLPAAAATSQSWVIACNAVGRHGVTGATFWGGSGIWAPSGLELVRASRVDDELIVVHNVDIRGAREEENESFDYAIDFREIYRPLGESRAFTRRDG